MTPAAIKAILINAPVIVDSVARLIGGLRKLGAGIPSNSATPATLDGLRLDLQRVEERLKENNDSDVEQLKLIEQLARQNEALAASVSRLNGKLSVLATIGVIALLLSLLALFFSRN